MYSTITNINYKKFIMTYWWILKSYSTLNNQAFSTIEVMHHHFGTYFGVNTYSC